MDALERAFSEGYQRDAIADRSREPVFGTNNWRKASAASIQL